MRYIKKSRERSPEDTRKLRDTVSAIISRVCEEKDAALRDCGRKFDGCEREKLRVSREEIRAAYDRVPPQIARDIAHEGIFLTGGVSMILNLPIYMQKEIGLPIYHIQDPRNSTIRGILALLKDKNLKKLTRMPSLTIRWTSPQGSV